MSKFNRERDAPGPAEQMSSITYKNKYGSFLTQSRDITRTMLQNQLSKYKNGCFVEIGVYGGATLFHLAELFPNAQIYGIDPHDKITIFNGQTINKVSKAKADLRINTYRQFRINIQNAIKKHSLNIHYINDTSWNAYTHFADKSIDVLFVDGDHSYSGVTKDLTLFYPKMSPSGIILIDDYNWAGVKKAVNEFVAKNKLTTSIPQVKNGTKLAIHMKNN